MEATVSWYENRIRIIEQQNAKLVEALKTLSTLYPPTSLDEIRRVAADALREAGAIQ